MGLFRRKHPTEDDVPLDKAVAWSREHGGVPDPDKPDQGSTTGTTASGEFVGRASADEAGDYQESGAERRAAAAAERDQPRES